jgi:hypothetical protein
MKAYKLIKKYPGSPELGTIVEHKKGTNMYFFNGLQICYPDDFPEFWEEVTGYKDYEILILSTDCFTGITNRTIDIQAFLEKSEGTKNWTIHSVKRLNDGEIFTIGDEISNSEYPDEYKGKISRFEIEDSKLLVFYYGFDYIESIQKVKPVLFTTHDGVDVREGDRVWYFDQGYKLWDSKADPKYHNGEQRFHYFSTKEAAEKYILMNKPLNLSIREICNFQGSMDSVFLEDYLKKLVKSKS